MTLNHPRDNGRTFFASDISRADYDQVAWTCGTDWQYLDRMGDQKFRPAAAPQEYLDTGDFGDALEPGAYRCYQVRAFTGAEANNGQGTWSNVAQASAGGEVPPEWGKCGASRTAITLYWWEPFYDGGAPVTGYQLQYSVDGERWCSLTSPWASAQSYTHAGLKDGDTRRYRIRARTAPAGAGGRIRSPSPLTLTWGRVCRRPASLPRATTATEIMLSWTRQCNPNRENDCEAKVVDGYYLEYSEDGVYDREGIRLRSDQTSFVHWGLEPGATLYYRVAGYEEVNVRDLPGRRSPARSTTTSGRRSRNGQNPWWGLTTRTMSNSIPMKERRRGRRKFRRFSRLAQPTRYSAFTLEGPSPC